MNVPLNTSLIQRAGVAVVASLWNRHDVTEDLKRLILDEPRLDLAKKLELHLFKSRSWRNIENKVLSLLQDIFIPVELKSMLNNLVQSMGTQIYKWMCITQETFQMCPSFPKSIRFVWDERGLLDYSKTAKLIIASSSDNLLCYLLACIICVEETILEFWPSVESFFKGKDYKVIRAMGSQAAVYWTCYLRGEIEQLRCELYNFEKTIDFYELGFLYLLDSYCVSSLKYFMQFIKPERRQVLVIEYFDNLPRYKYQDANVLIYLLSLLPESEANRIINIYCLVLLSSTLELPWHQHFMAIANSSWHSMTVKEFFCLINIFVHFSLRYHLDDAYAILFEQFWTSSPPALRQRLLDDISASPTVSLMKILLTENAEGIARVIMNDFTPEERKKIIFSSSGMNLCDLLVQKRDNCITLKKFVKMCIPDLSTLVAFIEKYKKIFPTDYRTDKRANAMYENLKKLY